MTALALDDPRHGTRRGYHLGCRRGSCPLPRYHDCTAAASHERYLRRIGELPPMAPGVGVKRRLQALKVRGWSGAELSRRLGYSDRTLVDQMIRERTLFEHATWVAVCRLYDKLSMVAGPSTRAAADARRRGWEPPLAWDDDTIDDPDAKPYRPRLHRRGENAPPTTAAVERDDLDEVVVERAMAGVRVRANARERAEVARRWTRVGGSLQQLDLIQGWNMARDQRLARTERNAA